MCNDCLFKGNWEQCEVGDLCSNYENSAAIMFMGRSLTTEKVTPVIYKEMLESGGQVAPPEKEEDYSKYKGIDIKKLKKSLERYAIEIRHWEEAYKKDKICPVYFFHWKDCKYLVPTNQPSLYKFSDVRLTLEEVREAVKRYDDFNCKTEKKEPTPVLERRKTIYYYLTDEFIQRHSLPVCRDMADKLFEWWSKAPEWAEWIRIDENGYAMYVHIEPILEDDVWNNYYFGQQRKMPKAARVYSWHGDGHAKKRDMTGIDWKKCKFKRPERK